MNEKYRLGIGKYRIEPSFKQHEIRTTVTLDERQDAALSKLKCFRGCSKSDVIELALDMALALPIEDLVRRVRERREGKKKVKDAKHPGEIKDLMKRIAIMSINQVVSNRYIRP